MDENKPSIRPYIITGIIAIAVVGGLIWYFSRTAVPKPVSPGQTTSGGGVFPGGTGAGGGAGGETGGGGAVEAAKRKIIQLTNYRVASPTINKKGDKLLFYARAGGDIFESDFQGTKQDKISNTTIVGIREAAWSPQKDKAIVWYLDKNELKKFIQAIATTTKIVFLPQNLTAAAWSPDGSSIAYLIPDGDNYNLITADEFNKNQRVRFKTPVSDFNIQWIGTNKIALSSAPSGFASSVLYILDLRSGNFSKILDNRYGFVPLWSPDGTKMIYSATDAEGKNLALYLRKADGEITRLNARTLAEKCVWSDDSKEIFCAVPRDFPAGPMPDSYYQGLETTSDNFVKIDADKNEESEIFNGEDFDASNLVLTKNKDYLFFINRKDGTLWSLNLSF